MFKSTFLIGMFIATELTHNPSDCNNHLCNEQVVSANDNVHMPIQQSYNASNVTNTESNTDLLTSIEKQISPLSKNITVFETMCVSRYTFLLYESIKFIEDNYFFDFYSVCNHIFQMDLPNNFHKKNICNHEKFKNSFNDYIVKYLDEMELLIKRGSILKTVDLNATCYEFVINFNSRSKLFKLLF
ncbi:hypothetical protein TUBRATIS_007380 [Tubulinosema ratisbonensis]|uniref:Uncharacterized protein n=1 Tax=Tubulinosema ratisbonensis TaxID=291195 RepID=A0A437ANQ7_9MICR|nr:hypothetical protein TUBRATIS_007380 [Tubulinosema ratisbonensis]